MSTSFKGLLPFALGTAISLFGCAGGPRYEGVYSSPVAIRAQDITKEHDATWTTLTGDKIYPIRKSSSNPYSLELVVCDTAFPLSEQKREDLSMSFFLEQYGKPYNPTHNYYLTVIDEEGNVVDYKKFDPIQTIASVPEALGDLEERVDTRLVSNRLSDNARENHDKLWDIIRHVSELRETTPLLGLTFTFEGAYFSEAPNLRNSIAPQKVLIAPKVSLSYTSEDGTTPLFTYYGDLVPQGKGLSDWGERVRGKGVQFASYFVERDVDSLVTWGKRNKEFEELLAQTEDYLHYQDHAEYIRDTSITFNPVDIAKRHAAYVRDVKRGKRERAEVSFLGTVLPLYPGTRTYEQVDLGFFEQDVGRYKPTVILTKDGPKNVVLLSHDNKVLRQTMAHFTPWKPIFVDALPLSELYNQETWTNLDGNLFVPDLMLAVTYTDRLLVKRNAIDGRKIRDLSDKKFTRLLTEGVMGFADYAEEFVK